MTNMPDVTVGIEFETETLTSRDVGNLSSFASPTHDASIETPTLSIPDLGAKCIASGRLAKRGSSNFVVGTEVVTTPLHLLHPDFFDHIQQLCKTIAAAGEPEIGMRSGIHIHIGVPEFDLADLKRIVKWGMFTESLFFQIACNGYTFRGYTNDAAFCRPITRCGPPAVPYGDGYILCFDTDNLLKAESTKRFWQAFGDTQLGNLTKYVPQRYVWLNWYSLLVRKTLEFRPFNKTLNPYRLMAEIELCARFTAAALTQEPPHEVNSLFDVKYKSPSELVDLLYKVASLIDLSDGSRDVLATIVGKSPIFSLEEVPMMTHLRDYPRPFRETSPWFTPVTANRPKQPLVVTVRNFREQSAPQIRIEAR